MPTSPITAGQIAAFLQGTLIGRAEVLIDSIAGLTDASPSALSFVNNDAALKQASSCRAAVLLTPRQIPKFTSTQIIVAHPALAMAKIAEEFFTAKPISMGVSNLAHLGKHVTLGEGVSIWPFVTVQEHVTIGQGSHLYPGVFVGFGSKIGDNCVIHPNVTILENVTIGHRVILHAGTVIGSDGFGYLQVGGRHRKIPQIGTVVIEDDVELGANVTVDRATFGQTIIRRGTKVDNLVQIAHNVEIGEDNILVAQVGIAGSSKTGHHVMIGGQAGIADHVEIGDQAMIAAQSGVSQRVAVGEVLAGTPGMPFKTWLKAMVITAKLPDLRDQIRDLEHRLRVLEQAASATASVQAPQPEPPRTHAKAKTPRRAR